MVNIILFDDEQREYLLPLTYTKPVAELRVGILKIKEKWEQTLNGSVSYITQNYLDDKYPIAITDNNFVINGSVLPSKELVTLINQLEFNEALLQDGNLIAARLSESQFDLLMNNEEIEELQGFEVGETPFVKINNLWDIFKFNDIAIQDDFELLTKGRKSCKVSSTNTVIGNGDIFIEKGAVVEGVILNASNGPIYFGKDCLVMEGSSMRGPIAICDNAVVKMGAKIYGATTIGKFSKAGGEVNNSVIMDYSNKGHEGYLGNSVLGEWVNMGADSNCSNLKNNYAEVKLWAYPEERFIKTGLQFCGLVMGDHSKCGINTMFNTGTIIGVSCNIFGADFVQSFVPSFSWGGHSGVSTYKLEKAFDTMEKMMIRKEITLTDNDKAIMENIFAQSSKFRHD